jgi:hypothetical protein
MTADQHRAYLDAIRPLNQLKARIVSSVMPTLMLGSDGRVERLYPPETTALLDTIDDLIAIIGERYGV